MIRTSLLRITIRSRIKILPTSTGHKKAVSMNFWILFSRLARARRDLADIDDKNRKFKEILSKKCLSKSENPKNSWFSSKIFSLLFYKFWCFSTRNCNIKSNSQRNRRENAKIRRYSREQADLNFTIFHQISAKFHRILQEKRAAAGCWLLRPRPRAEERGAGFAAGCERQSARARTLRNEQNLFLFKKISFLFLSFELEREDQDLSSFFSFFFVLSSEKTQKICLGKLVFLVFLVSCCFLIWKMNTKFSEFLNCGSRFPASGPPLSLWSLRLKISQKS